MLRLSSYLKVIHDAKGLRIDHVHGVAVAIGDVNQLQKALHRGTELSHMSFRVDVVGINYWRHARQSVDRGSVQQTHYRPDSNGEQYRPAVLHPDLV